MRARTFPTRDKTVSDTHLLPPFVSRGFSGWFGWRIFVRLRTRVCLSLVCAPPDLPRPHRDWAGASSLAVPGDSRSISVPVVVGATFACVFVIAGAAILFKTWRKLAVNRAARNRQDFAMLGGVL